MAEEELQRSTKIQQRIDQVRDLPAATPEEKIHKQEQAKLLRMEMWLDNAQLTRELIEALEENPRMTKEDFIARVRERGNILHPEKTEFFVERLVSTRDKVIKADELLRKEAEATGKGLAETILTSLSEDHQPPKGKVELIKEGYPLALCLEVNAKDFARLDPEINIGGFYRGSADLDLEESREQVSGVPIIIMEESSRGDYLRHEEGHAEIAPYRTALFLIRGAFSPRGKHLTVWGQPSFNLTEFEGIKEKMASGEKPERWNDLVVLALSRAKEELLADMKSESQIIDIKSHLENSLLERGGVYDFFIEGMSVKEDSKLHLELWEDYSAKLKESTESALDLAVLYSAQSAWRKRAELFRWVLAQIPIAKWEEQLGKTLFIEEGQEYISLDKKIGLLGRRLTPPSKDWSNYQDEQSLSMHLRDIKESLLSEIKKSSDKPLLDTIRGYKQQVADLEKRVIATAAYKENEALISYRDKVHYLSGFVRMAFSEEKADEIMDEVCKLFDINDDLEKRGGEKTTYEMIKIYEERLEQMKTKIQILWLGEAEDFPETASLRHVYELALMIPRLLGEEVPQKTIRADLQDLKELAKKESLEAAGGFAYTLLLDYGIEPDYVEALLIEEGVLEETGN